MAEVSMCSSSGRAELSPEEERVLVRDISIAAEVNSKEGDTFYLITQRWWQHWIDYVNQDQSNNINDGSSLSDHCDSGGSSGLYRPASIDNADLIYDAKSEDSNMGIEIHDTLLEGRDYVLLPQEVWNQLHSWYGGGPTLPRKVISSGLSQSELAVEVYPLRLQLLVMPKGDHAIIRISKKETIGELHRRACEIFYLNLKQVRVWDYYGHQKHALMSDMDKTLDDANIQMDQDILVEVLNNVNGCFSASKGASRNSGSEQSQNHDFATTGRELDSTYANIGVTTRGATRGLTGLLNLGNTCFMNSAIQCLVHTQEFARYFRGDYHREINRHNPMGMAGDLALAFGELLRKLWAPGRTTFSPRQFKATLARFAAQFSGYNQHDSQELLTFLLDGLHEDLNRVKHKPSIKSRDADGRPDEEVADEYWKNCIARNDSIIADVCQGQFKSTLVCPVCHKVSVTFDPFMHLSLPLQSTTIRSMTVTVFTCDGTALPSVTTVTVPKQGRFRDLIQAVSSSCSLKQNDELKIAEIKNHLIQRLIEDPLTSLSTIKDNDCLAAYKIPKSMKSSILLQLIHRCQEKEVSNTQTASRWKPCGTPLLSSISLDGVITSSEVQKMVQKMLSPLLKVESLGDTDFSQPSNFEEASDQSHDISPDEASTKSKSDLIRDSTDSKVELCSGLPLQMVDEKNVCIDLSVEEEKAIPLSKSSTFIVVYFDWSEKLLGMFDMNYLENLPEVFRYGPVTKKTRSEPLSLYTCLKSFLCEEPLVSDEMWYCPQCKEQRQASKKLDFWRLPNVLVIHLKRFSYSRSMKHKLETFVDFPVHDFDLTNYVASKGNSQRQLYELYALTNHYGSMGSGHYTAHIKILDENKWYNFDDSHISQINEEEVKSAAAYVLFYRRVKTNDANGNGAGQARSHQ